MSVPAAFSTRRCGLFVGVSIAIACGGWGMACGGAIAPSSAAPDASSGTAASDAGASLDCPDTGDAPGTLACTGLYDDFAAKHVAAGAREYAPAYKLWSDGAEKQRWIALPEGTTIDGTSPDEWRFPIGTRVWKEFRVGGKRIETRYFVKLRDAYWAHATYAWNADDSDAPRSFGGDIRLSGDAGATYHLPTPTECDQCHKGRTDRILGFEAVGLGLDGATGFTLDALVAEGRIAPAPASTKLRIGDDGTGADVAALGWLHVNCGVACHNGNSNAKAYSTGLRLRLDPAQLDGRPASGWDSIVTTENAPATSPAWSGQLRIVPGDPDDSLLVRLIQTRTSDSVGQMPPLASRVVDQDDVAIVASWIQKMPRAIAIDAGAPDAAGDASDASTIDASDAAASDASDASLADAADAGAPDASAGDASGDASADDAMPTPDDGSADAADDVTPPDAG